MTIKQQINQGAIHEVYYWSNSIFYPIHLRQFYSITSPTLLLKIKKLWNKMPASAYHVIPVTSIEKMTFLDTYL